MTNATWVSIPSRGLELIFRNITLEEVNHNLVTPLSITYYRVRIFLEQLLINYASYFTHSSNNLHLPTPYRIEISLADICEYLQPSLRLLRKIYVSLGMVLLSTL